MKYSCIVWPLICYIFFILPSHPSFVCHFCFGIGIAIFTSKVTFLCLNFHLVFNISHHYVWFEVLDWLFGCTSWCFNSFTLFYNQGKCLVLITELLVTYVWWILVNWVNERMRNKRKMFIHVHGILLLTWPKSIIF